jgi:hypothetical protein
VPFRRRRYNRTFDIVAKGIMLSQLTLVVVFALHLLCVNVASAGPLVCAWFEWCEGRGNALAGEAGRYLAVWALLLLIPGGLLGVGVGWMLWEPEYHQVLRRLLSRIHYGGWELLFSLVLMAVHLAWWRMRPQCPPWQRGVRIFLALLASTNLLYHFPVLFAVIEQLATSEQSSATAEKILPAEFRALLVQPAIIARSLHFLLAAIATCGILLLGYALRMMRQKRAADDCQRVAAWGGQIALIPTLLQLPVGLWLTVSLPPALQHAVTGGDIFTTTLFLISVGGAFALMQTLSAIAIGDAERPRLIRAMVLMLAVVVLMGGVLQRLRATAHHANSDIRTPAAALQ